MNADRFAQRPDQLHQRDADGVRPPALPEEIIATYIGDGAGMLVRRALGDPEDERWWRTPAAFPRALSRAQAGLHLRLSGRFRVARSDAYNRRWIAGKNAVLTNKPVGIGRDLHALGLSPTCFAFTAATVSPARSPPGRTERR